MVKEEPSPHVKDHNGTKICFADTLTQASNALQRKQLPENTQPGDLNDAHLMLFGVEDWTKSKIGNLNKALGNNLNQFKRLEIFGCEIEESLQKELANGLSGGNLESVKQLDLDNTSLTAAGAKAIFTNVAEAANIETLNLQGSVKSAAVLKAIDTAMPGETNIFRNLSKVDMKINDLKAEAGEYIKNLIEKFVVEDEVELDLFYNDLQATGAQHIARGLQVDNCKLTILDLCCNNIQDAGAEALAGALRTNESLKVLKLALNSIGNKGGIALFKSLSSTQASDNVNQNKTLRVLDLSANVMKGEKSDGQLTPDQKARLAELEDETKYPKDKKNDEWYDEHGKLDQLRQVKNELAESLCDLIDNADHLNEIDFTGIEFDDNGWDQLGTCLNLSAKGYQRATDPDVKPKMTIKFSIVDLMSTERLQQMEAKIWAKDIRDNFDHIDWRRRDVPEEKKEGEEKKTN